MHCRTLSDTVGHTVGLSDCRTVGLSDYCRIEGTLGQRSLPTAARPGHLAVQRSALWLHHLCHPLLHHLFVLLVEQVGARKARVLLEVHLADDLEVARPHKRVAIVVEGETVAKKSE